MQEVWGSRFEGGSLLLFRIRYGVMIMMSVRGLGGIRSGGDIRDDLISIQHNWCLRSRGLVQYRYCRVLKLQSQELTLPSG